MFRRSHVLTVLVVAVVSAGCWSEEEGGAARTSTPTISGRTSESLPHSEEPTPAPTECRGVPEDPAACTEPPMTEP